MDHATAVQIVTWGIAFGVPIMILLLTFIANRAKATADNTKSFIIWQTSHDMRADATEKKLDKHCDDNKEAHDIIMGKVQHCEVRIGEIRTELRIQHRGNTQ